MQISRYTRSCIRVSWLAIFGCKGQQPNHSRRVGDDLKSLIAKNNVEAYFSGNAVCKVDSTLDCEPLCSKTCWGREAPGDGVCNIECNSKECDYDGGDCK